MEYICVHRVVIHSRRSNIFRLFCHLKLFLLWRSQIALAIPSGLPLTLVTREAQQSRIKCLRAKLVMQIFSSVGQNQRIIFSGSYDMFLSSVPAIVLRLRL